MSNDKLVKISELPLHGNPHPPKEVAKDEPPSFLEQNVTAIRQQVQPYMAPVCRAYAKTSDVLSVGAAHTQSTLENLRENQRTLYNALVISGSTLLGLGLARRRGVFKKLLYTSVFFGASAAVCYPEEAKAKADLVYLIAQNKLPELLAKFKSKEQ